MREKLLISVILFILMSIIFPHHSYAAEPYVLGYQTDITGPGGANYAPPGEGFRLYFETVNDRGGINGHPVKVIYEDDKSLPSRASAVATKLILEDKVLAICGLGFSQSHPPVYELAKKHKVPVVVPFSCVATVFDPIKDNCREVFATGEIMHLKFPFHGYVPAQIVKRLFPKGTTVGSSSYATPGGRALSLYTAESLRKVGYKVVYHEDVPLGTVDISAWAQKVAKINPDIYLGQFGADLMGNFLSNLEKLGWTGSMFVASFMGEGDFVKAMDQLIKPRSNIYWFGMYAPAFVDIPEFDKIRKAMEKYGHKYPLSSRHANGWTTARVVEAALIKAGWPCDRSALLNALEQTDLDTRGLTGGPIRFNPNDHYGTIWAKAYRWVPEKRTLESAMDWFKMDPKKIVAEMD